jgi:fructokinase
MGRALAAVINVLDPEVIVLGGGLSNITRLYENVPRVWDALCSRAVVPDTHASAARGARRCQRRPWRRVGVWQA